MRRKPARATEVSEFVSQLSVLCRAGFTVHAALISISENRAEGSRLGDALANVRRDLSEGKSFSESLAKHPHVFDPSCISFVRQGELTGRMGESLSCLADFMTAEREHDQLWRRFVSATVYPLVILALFPLGLSLISFILPGSALTRIVRFLVAFLLIYWRPAVLSIVLWMLLQFRPIKEWADRTLLRVILVGKVALQILRLRVVRILETTNRAGFPERESLLLAAGIIRNTSIAAQVRAMAETMALGANLAAAIRVSPLLPPAVSEAIAFAQEIGKLDETLAHTSLQMSAEAVEEVRRLTRYSHAVTIVFINVAIVLLALALAAR